MKTNRELARLVIRDLKEFNPEFKFAHVDRLTKQEADQVRQWGAKDPRVARAAMDRSNPHHQAVALFRNVVEHFTWDHPQTGEQPAAWPARAPTGRKATDEDPFAELHPDEAAARFAWAQTRPEYAEAMQDRNHPQHAAIVAQTEQLTKMAKAAEQPSTVEGPVGGKADFDARLAILQEAPGYMDRNHPGHAAAVAAVRRHFEAAYPNQPGPDGKPIPRPPVDPEALRQEKLGGKIAEIMQDPAYLNGADPGHAQAVGVITRAFQAAYPEPAQEGDKS
jgi:hypothetical protein